MLSEHAIEDALPTVRADKTRHPQVRVKANRRLSKDDVCSGQAVN